VDPGDFSASAGITKPEELRTDKRAHIIAWRKQLEVRGLEPSSRARQRLDYHSQRRLRNGQSCRSANDQALRSAQGPGEAERNRATDCFRIEIQTFAKG
jgi:hypothetical protein